MKTNLFQFELPAELIADAPRVRREEARLLHLSPDGRIDDKRVADWPEMLRPTDVLVFNDTKVIPARLFGKRGEAQVEATLFRQESAAVWTALVKNARRLKEGDVIRFAADFEAAVNHKKADGSVVLAFNHSGAALMEKLHQVGTMPLPPYIKRPKGGRQTDFADYQTVFARAEGAVAAPTAGLHFTPQLLDRLAARGIERLFVTLHVGGGTFLPVKVDDTDKHVMHAETGILSADAAQKINAFKAQGRRIIPVGTTALRLLESAADEAGRVQPFQGETKLFITPGYLFKAVDALWTNFHLPASTLFMLVCAWAGTDAVKKAYRHAICEKYRFFSYGDACFFEKPIPAAPDKKE